MSGFFTTIGNRKKPINVQISGFFTTIRNRKKPFNLLIEVTNVGEFYSRSSIHIRF